jgi:hypothetical protein
MTKNKEKVNAYYASGKNKFLHDFVLLRRIALKFGFCKEVTSYEIHTLVSPLFFCSKHF